MNEQNTFKFSLYQNEILLCEKMFNADNYSPFTRYSVDIRNILPKIITNLQKILSRKSYNYIINVGGGMSYDSLKNRNDILKHYPNYIKKDMKYDPKSVEQEFDKKVIKGVECLIGLYINDKTIVERVFYVDNFNPTSRWSVELLELFAMITDEIEDQIKTNDLKNIWDDYDLINVKGYNIDQIRKFRPDKRQSLLNSLSK